MEERLEPSNLGSADPAPVASVLAVDDQPSFRAAVCELVAATDGMEVVAEAGCGEEAIELVERLRPDLVVMDVAMPGIGGIAAARSIKSSHHSTVVVLISSTPPEELPTEAEESSADAVVWKLNLRPKLLREIWARRGRRPHTLPAAQ